MLLKKKRNRYTNQQNKTEYKIKTTGELTSTKEAKTLLWLKETLYSISIE